MPKYSVETVELFKELARRRRALGIVEQRWHVLFDTAALQSMDEYWATFVAVLGKERAVDYLIVLMRYGFETLERVLREKNKKRVGKQRRQRSDPTGPTL